MKWDIFDDDLECAKVFDNFGTMIKDLIMDCVSMPNRYFAKIRLNTHENIATLKFYEVINNYRCVEMLTIVFSPTPWEQVIMEVGYDLRRMMDYHSKLKTALVKVLEIVSKHQPTLLLSCNGAGNIRAHQITQSAKWKELVETLLPTKDSAFQEGASTQEESLNRKEMFLKATENLDSSEFICSKNISIKFRRGEEEDYRKLLFTFYSQGPSKSPLYYFITVTDPNDIFLYFKSIEITHTKFLEITTRLNINVPGIEPDSKMDSMVSENPRRAREAALGFHTSEGAGGVVGIIAGDCLSGTQREPDRYHGCFEIFDFDNNPSFSLSSSFDSEIDTQLDQKAESSKAWKDDRERGFNNNGWSKVMSSKLGSPSPVMKNPEVLKKGRLSFKERVLYRTNHLLSIPFEELPREELMTKVNDQYMNLQIEIQSAQNRLDSVLESTKRKNVALRTLLEAVDIPKPDSLIQKNDLNRGINYYHENITDKLESIVDDEGEYPHQPKSTVESGMMQKGNGIQIVDSTHTKPRPIKQSSGLVKKLPIYRHPSSQSKKPSPFYRDETKSSVKKRSSGLVPDLLQPYLVAMNI